jgi:hypothetical protein
MLRQAQHELDCRNHFEVLSVRPEPVEGLSEGYFIDASTAFR